MPLRISCLKICILLFGVLSLQALPAVCQFSTENTLFADSFESYPVGAFPSTGNWSIIYGGQGSQYQVIAENHSVSPTKSLQLWGSPNWACAVQKSFISNSSLIGYELSVLISATGPGGPERTDYSGFYNKNSASWGGYFAALYFNHDNMTILTEDSTVVGYWVPEQWTKVRVILDRATNTYGAWLNGVFVGAKFKTKLTDTNNINSLGIWSGHPGVRTYYDDIRVFETTENLPLISPGTLSPPPTPTTDSKGRIAYWKLDEQSGVSIKDSVGINDGVIEGNPSWTTGVSNNALKFNGNSFAAVSDRSNIGSSSITVETWVTLDAIDVQFLVCKGNDRTEGSFLLSTRDDGFSFELGPYWLSNQVSVPLTLKTQVWYYLVGTYDGDWIKIYVNGVIGNSKQVGRIEVGNSSPLYLSYNDVSGFPYYLSGTLDEVAIYNSALSAVEISDNYARMVAANPAILPQVSSEPTLAPSDPNTPNVLLPTQSAETISPSLTGAPPFSAQQTPRTSANPTDNYSVFPMKLDSWQIRILSVAVVCVLEVFILYVLYIYKRKPPKK